MSMKLGAGAARSPLGTSSAGCAPAGSGAASMISNANGRMAALPSPLPGRLREGGWQGERKRAREDDRPEPRRRVARRSSREAGAMKNPGTAAVLSLIVPGVGQIYNGEFL